jgi:hypothetical protein
MPYPRPPSYVQAKSTEYFDDNWGSSINRTTIGYWLNQLLPVFLVVYDEENKKCYWMSVEDRRYDLLGKMATNRDTIYIQLDRSHILCEAKDSNKEFNQFLNIARRSTFENANILILSRKRNLIAEIVLERLLDKLDHLCRQITNFQDTLV